MDLRAIHDTTKLLNDDATLELFVWTSMALVTVVICSHKTPISFIYVFLMFITIMRVLRRFRALPGHAALRGESGCSPWKALLVRRR